MKKVENAICYNAPTVEVLATGLFKNVERNMTITVERFAVGDTVIWRQGKSKSDRHLPIGIANCKILRLGQSPYGQRAAEIELPPFFHAAMAEQGIHHGVTWALIADLE